MSTLITKLPATVSAATPQIPDSSLCFAKEQLSGSKKALDRITVMVCANMPGTEKKEALSHRKEQEPQMFQGG